MTMPAFAILLLTAAMAPAHAQDSAAAVEPRPLPQGPAAKHRHVILTKKKTQKAAAIQAAPACAEGATESCKIPMAPVSDGTAAASSTTPGSTSTQ